MAISGLTSSFASSPYSLTGSHAAAADGLQKNGSPHRSNGAAGSPNASLSDEEKAQVDKLKKRDREVRLHEQAHMAAGAGLVTSGASYSYQKGPDGVNYAIGGEVGINTSPGRTPDETIQRARQIRAAALAPADPSGQDRAIAAQATQMEQQARAEQAQEKMETGTYNPTGGINHDRPTATINLFA